MTERSRLPVSPAPTPLADYRPEVGLKRLVVAEVAVKHFQRAKDATRLLDAVELKLAEQRKFVLWWDGQAKGQGQRTDLEHRRGPATKSLAGRDGLPDRDTIARWRGRLKDEARYRVTLEQAQARCWRICEGQLAPSQRAINTGEYEWYTPAVYLDAARDVLGAIDLDPASSAIAQRAVRATRYFTREEDGLRHPWPGRVWLNPPYTQPDINDFVAKLVDEVQAGRTSAAILLTHNSTDTAWFHLALGACALVCFTRGRIGFLDPLGHPCAPTQGQAFFYFGADPVRCAERFASSTTPLWPAR